MSVRYLQQDCLVTDMMRKLHSIFINTWWHPLLKTAKPTTDLSPDFPPTKASAAFASVEASHYRDVRFRWHSHTLPNVCTSTYAQGEHMQPMLPAYEEAHSAPCLLRAAHS